MTAYTRGQEYSVLAYGASCVLLFCLLSYLMDVQQKRAGREAASYVCGFWDAKHIAPQTDYDAATCAEFRTQAAGRGFDAAVVP